MRVFDFGSGCTNPDTFPTEELAAAAADAIRQVGADFTLYPGDMGHRGLRDLMAALSKRGLDTEALVHQSDITFNSRRELCQTDGQALHVTRAAVWARFLFTPISPTFPWLLSRLIRTTQPDILHLHLPNVSAFWALLLPGARRIPWVVHWHADVLASRHGTGLRLFYKVYRPLEHAILKHCQAIIVTSPPYLEYSQPLQRFHSKCQLVPLGLDPCRLPHPPSREPSTDPDKPLRVLAIGRLTYYKGFEYLIQAAREFDGVEVHLVGRGDQETKLKALVHELNLENRVTFHGHLASDELAKQFSLCDCVCLPSLERTEAFGLVLLEAMYYGIATIISKVPGSGMGWVVDDGITGLHVPPESARVLADTMRNLQRNRDKIIQLGERGRQKFDQQFHIDKSAARVSQLYKLVLEDAPKTSNRPDYGNKRS